MFPGAQNDTLPGRKAKFHVSLGGLPKLAMLSNSPAPAVPIAVTGSILDQSLVFRDKTAP